MKLTNDLANLALILWSGMLVIAGSIWVLSSQVGKLAELLEDRRSDSVGTRASSPRTARTRNAATGRVRRASRPTVVTARSQVR